jgi:methyltransferase-like protein/SAM-dependent methyltransferase
MSDKFSYEEFPYPSKFFLQTHPDRLATAGVLHGMEPALPENCRVLELGCGNGSNLIAQAFGLPDSRFVGIDLAENHIERAKQSVDELKLGNVEFRQMDVMEMRTEDFGEFDYITAHGLFAWVPEFVREKVLAIFSEMLSQNGIGYISYNAYPGAYAREMVRSMMKFHTDNIDEPMAKVDSAIPFLGMLVNHSTEREIQGHILEFELKRHFNHFPADIYHDDLSECYQPFHFYEFASLLEKNGMQFLSEAELHASGLQGLGEEAIAFLDNTKDRIRREQYLDFLRGRVFRQTLFCRGDIKLIDTPQPQVLDRLYLSSTLRPVEKITNPGEQKVEKFRSAKGQQIQIDHPLTKAALIHLGEIWGKSVRTTELLETAKQRLESTGVRSEDWEHQFEIARSILLQIALGSDMIELHIYEPRANTDISETPKVNALARWQLRDANNVLTLLNKDLGLNDKTSRHLLEILDGTRTKGDIVNAMKGFIEKVDDINEKEKRDLLSNLRRWVDNSISELTRIGLFES